MKKIIFIFTLLLSFNIFAKENSPEYVFIESISENVFSQLGSKEENTQEEIEIIVNNNLADYIDYKYISLKVIGKNFKNHEKEDIIEFMQVMKPYVLDLFVNAFSFYDNHTILINPQTRSSGSMSTVYVMVKKSGEPDIDLIFKLRKDKESFKVYDIVAEGISMLSSKQSEFAPVIRKDGLKEATRIIKGKIQ
tara:strand:+ start:5932 stop:6510 length:579 start_codon:yes stop_codon:yes gene_type:complete